MTDIIGYDVNGEPLRAGDKIEIVGARQERKRFIGKSAEVLGPNKHWFSTQPSVEIQVESVDGTGIIWCSHVRKIKDDSQGRDGYTDQHKPCGLSFDELKESFKEKANERS